MFRFDTSKVSEKTQGAFRLPPELMQNFRNAQEEIGLIETEIRHAERELKFLKEKRLKIFEGL